MGMYDWIDPFGGAPPDVIAVSNTETGRVIYSGGGTLIGFADFYLVHYESPIRKEANRLLAERLRKMNPFFRAFMARKEADAPA